MSQVRRFFITALGTALLALPLAGQAELTGPTSGVVFHESSQSLRPVIGVPGAAYLGGAIGDRLDLAAAAPDGRRALVSAGGRLSLIQFDAESRDLESSAQVAAIAWSADSKAVAAAFESRTILWRNLDGDTERVELAASPSEIRALATDGNLAAVATARGIYLLRSTEAQLVPNTEDTAAVTISGGDLYAAIRGRGEVIALRGFAGSSAPLSLAGPSAGLRDVVGVGASGDVVIAADKAERAVFLIRSNTGEMVRRIDVDFAPTRVEALGRGVFRLNSGVQDEPMQVLALGSRPDLSEAATYFIPAAEAGNSVED